MTHIGERGGWPLQGMAGKEQRFSLRIFFNPYLLCSKKRKLHKYIEICGLKNNLG